MQPLTNPGSPAHPLCDDFFEFPAVEAAEAETPPKPVPVRPGLVQEWSDAASRAGFVISFLFLIGVGLYALSLSGRLGLNSSSVSDFADGAAGEAGFAVKHVSIDGLRHMPESEVHAALSSLPQRSILFFDTEAARDRLLEIGWVENAQVQRTLPDQLHITIAERQPFARWKSPDGLITVIDAEGRVLGEAREGLFGTLPLLTGEGAPREARSLVPLIASRKGLLNRIASAEWVAGRYWTLHLNEGPQVKLRRDPDERTLQRVEELLANRDISGVHVAALDLRLPNRVVLELKDRSVASREKLVALLRSANEPIKPRARKPGAL